MNHQCVSALMERNGMDVAPDQVSALLEYERLLLEWNVKINLVSRRVTGDFFLRHVIGSVSFLFHHPLSPDTTLADVGTGGGLPGIPLAIIYPRIHISLIDSIRKKINAVTQICTDLALPNIRPICNRVEEIDPGATGTFDYIVARGISGASRLARWCEPLLKKRPSGGRVSTSSGAVHHTDTAGDSNRGDLSRHRIPPGSYIFLKGGDISPEIAGLKDNFLVSHPTGSVTVDALDVAVPPGCEPAAGDIFNEKKVIIVTP